MEELNISDDTICSMLELNPYLKDLTQGEIKEKLEILRCVNCTEDELINIISANPMFLDRTNKEIVDLIKCLTEFNFKNLNILFDSNPYILNLEPFEIRNYIMNRTRFENIDDIIDDLDSNPYLFNEM